jgi:nitrogen fixation NifU-like protein
MSMRDLYQQDLLDHYQHPRNFGLLEKYDFVSPLYNPSCGDSVTFSGRVRDGMLSEITFEGKGCVLSIAMASKLTEHSKNMSCNDIARLSEETVFFLLAMDLGFKRMQCGMLPIQALQKGVKAFVESL